MTPPAPTLQRAASLHATVPAGAARPRDARPPEPSVLRVGGMAFGNGVLMRSGGHWAWARDDGCVLHGAVLAPLSRRRWVRLPLLRSIVAFFEMLMLSARLHRLNGGRRAGRLLLSLGVCVALSLALGVAVHALIGERVVADAVLQVLGLLLALAVLQVGMGADVWRYHGAEHKAVNAYEARADLHDVATVSAFSRIHDRCGTNLVLVVIALTLLYVPVAGSGLLGQALSLVAALFALAGALELFRLLQRYPRWLLSRAVLACGRALQRLLTTRDPGPEHLALACAALLRVVELESAAAG